MGIILSYRRKLKHQLLPEEPGQQDQQQRLLGEAMEMDNVKRSTKPYESKSKPKSRTNLRPESTCLNGYPVNRHIIYYSYSRE